MVVWHTGNMAIMWGLEGMMMYCLWTDGIEQQVQEIQEVAYSIIW